MEQVEDYVMEGWPGRIAFMDTTRWMHCFEYRVSEIDPHEREEGLWDLREKRTHPLSGKTERVYTYCKYDENGIIYYSSRLYAPLVEAKIRVIKCLRWKWAENFAQK